MKFLFIYLNITVIRFFKMCLTKSQVVDTNIFLEIVGGVITGFFFAISKTIAQ